jgi:predicted RecB family nuclease
MRLDARTSLYCHEYLHKKNAPNRFVLTPLAEDDEITKERKRMGDIHEAKVIELLKSTSLAFIQIDQSKAIEDREVDTAKALLDPAIEIIFGATIGGICEEVLKKTLGTHHRADPDRTSRPDVLIKTGEIDDRPLWSPVDIKSHKAFNAENKSNQVEITDISSGGFTAKGAIAGRLEEDDAMQLAHYSEHLARIGVRNSAHMAGIIGADATFIAWADLNQTLFGRGKNAQSAVVRYHEQFAIAQQIIAQSLIHAKDATAPAPAIPMYITGTHGCPECTFRRICLKEMEDFDNGAGHVTLLATITPIEQDRHFPNIHSIKELRDVSGLSDFGVKAQTRARVWLSGKPELINPTTQFNLPRFDIEVDIDLENSMEALRERDAADSLGKDRVYLYGIGVHDRTVDLSWKSAVFQSIYNFDDTDDAEYDVLLRTWQRLHEVVADAENAGKSIGIFHYSPHEKSWWRKFTRQHVGKPGVPTEAEADIFMGDYFVDLLDFTRAISFPTMSYSIKKLAPLAKFEWNVSDPGGALSLLKYKESIDQSSNHLEREVARDWLISYNLDDVRATFAVREYLRDLSL